MALGFDGGEGRLGEAEFWQSFAWFLPYFCADFSALFIATKSGIFGSHFPPQNLCNLHFWEARCSAALGEEGIRLVGVIQLTMSCHS